MAQTARHKWLNRLLAGTLCVVAVCVVQQAVVLMAADWSSSITRHELGKWSGDSKPYTPQQWEQARESLETALLLTPKDAILHEALAQLHSLRGHALWTTGELGSPEVAAYQEAIGHLQTSIKLRPTHAMAWANLALLQYAANLTPEEVLRSWREAARLGPREDGVINTLLAVATEIWWFAPDDVRLWSEQRQPGLTAKLDAVTDSKP
jgi:tetratricopeptide (TPR) repeat protein